MQPKDGAKFARDAHDWEFLFENVPIRLRQLYALGYRLVLFTNQKGISLGKQSRADVIGRINEVIAAVCCEYIYM